MSHMDQRIEWLHALGKPIEIGKQYGYSSGSNGFANTVVGTAIKLTPAGNVTLDNLSIKRYLYGKPIAQSWERASKVSVSPFKLFPVHGALDV